jgi:hypothetical protein
MLISIHTYPFTPWEPTPGLSGIKAFHLFLTLLPEPRHIATWTTSTMPSSLPRSADTRSNLPPSSSESLCDENYADIVQELQDYFSTEAYLKSWWEKYPERDRATPAQLLDDSSCPPSQTANQSFYTSAINKVEEISAARQKVSDGEDRFRLEWLREDVKEFYDSLPENAVETKSQVMDSKGMESIMEEDEGE